MTSSPASTIARNVAAMAPKAPVVMAMSAASNSIPTRERNDLTTAATVAGSLPLYSNHRSERGAAHRAMASPISVSGISWGFPKTKSQASGSVAIATYVRKQFRKASRLRWIWRIVSPTGRFMKAPRAARSGRDAACRRRSGCRTPGRRHARVGRDVLDGDPPIFDLALVTVDGLHLHLQLSGIEF